MLGATIVSELLRTCHLFFFFQAEDGIRDVAVTGVQTCALPISGPGTRSSRRDCASRAPGGRSPAPVGRRCSSSAWRPSGTTGARPEPARSRSPARRLPPAAELDVYGRARELPRLAKPVQEVTCVRLGNLVGPVGHDGEAGRRSADLGGGQEGQRLADGPRRGAARPP